MIFSGVVSFITLKNLEINSVRQSLERNIILLENFISHYPDYEKPIRQIAAQTALRVTVIDAAGVVLAESDYDKEEMNNHLMRPEVQMSMKEPYGFSIRYSNTLGHDLLYVAKQSLSHDGNPITVRMAESLEHIHQRFLTLWIRIASIFFVAIVIALIVSGIFSKKIKTEVEKIKDILEMIANKEYEWKSDKESFVSEFTQIKNLLSQIAKRMSRRDRQKRKYEAKLRLKNRQQKDIIAALSHEFKNPIAVILGYSQTIKDDKAMPDAMRNKFLDKIDKNAHRISSMLDRLSLATKMENHEITPNAVYFDLHDLARDVKHMLEDKYSGRKILVEGVNRGVRADKTMIEMVLINLCENALKYSKEDVRLVIDPEKVSVIDEGQGISEEEIDKITKKFYRAQHNTWDNSLGLGLSIVNYMLKLHNTRLLIASKEGEGSVFSFFI